MRRSLYILFALLMVDYTLTADEINSKGASAVEFDIQEELDEHLNLFESAVQYIRQGNPDALGRLDADFDEAISLFADWSRARQAIARGIRVRTASDEEINRLAVEFLESVMDATSARIEVSMSWPFFIETHREPDRFSEQLEDFITVHQTLFEKGEEMYRNRTAVTLPAMADLYGPTQVDLAAGHRCEIEYLFENNGTFRWSEIQIRVETFSGEASEDVWALPEQVASLSPGKAVRFHLCIDDDYTGQDLFQLLIRSDEISKRETIRIIERH